MRGLAIFSILLLHYFVYPVVRADVRRYTDAVAMVGSHLWAGVDLFFVLSGYLIAAGLMRDRGREDYFALFFVRRCFRILPLYGLLLLVYLAATAIAGGILVNSSLVEESYPSLAYLFFVQNYYLARSGEYGGDLMAATWSLAIEVQFYLLIPLLIRYLPDRRLLVLCATVVVLSAVARLWFAYPASYAYTFCRGDGLFMGVAVAVMQHGKHWPGIRRLLQDSGRHVAAVTFAVYTAVALCLPFAGGALNHLAFSGCYTALLLVVLANPGWRMASLLRTPWLVWLGQASYGLYLFHYGLLSIMFFVVQDHIPTLGSPGDAALLAFSLTVTLALVRHVHLHVENPMIRAGNLICRRLRVATP